MISLRQAASALFTLLFATTTLSLPISRRSDQLCNGHSELCDRSYGNVTFLGAHDSFAASGNPFALARTQEVDVTAQLNAGVRMLQIQAHKGKGKFVQLCHSNCMLWDGGHSRDYFHQVKRFMDSHPNEVVTIVIANKAELKPTDFASAFNDSGLADLAYVPPQPLMSRDDWPKLGDMITTKKRLVVFLDKGAEARTNVPDGTQYILPQFQMMWEDVYDPTDSKFPCKVDRTQGPLAPAQQLSLVNQNLNTNILPIGKGVLIPDRLDSPRTNGVNSILKHAAHCTPYTNDKNPNFILVDFVGTGNAKLAVDMLNGLAR